MFAMFHRLKAAAYYICLALMAFLFLVHFWLALYPPADPFRPPASHANTYRELPDASGVPASGL